MFFLSRLREIDKKFLKVCAGVIVSGLMAAILFENDPHMRKVGLNGTIGNWILFSIVLSPSILFSFVIYCLSINIVSKNLSNLAFLVSSCVIYFIFIELSFPGYEFTTIFAALAALIAIVLFR